MFIHYPVFLSCFFDKAKVVVLMLLRHTFHTHQLLVIRAEELMFWTMDTTEHTLIFCWNPASLLIHERLAHALKSPIFQWRAFCHISAEWTFLHHFLTPGYLETMFAETVTTLQNHWILKDSKTNRAFRVFFQVSVRWSHDCFFWFWVPRWICLLFPLLQALL